MATAADANGPRPGGGAAASAETSLLDPSAEGQGLETPALALSWRRCAERGMRRELSRPLPAPASLPPLGDSAMSRQLALVRPALEDVYQFLEGMRCALACVDVEGRLLDVVGDAGLADELSGIGWGAGGCWSEECAGTNGLALALLEAFPTQVVGRQHYCAFLVPYATSAAPVYDSLGGLVGALMAVTPAEEASAQTLGMIAAAATALTGELRMNLWLASANELLSELNAILQTLAEGILLLSADGMVAQMNARAGHLLGLTPSRAAGRRLAEIVDVPPVLEDALRRGRELHDEEVTFHARGERVACICTLRAILAPAAPAGVPAIGAGLEGVKGWVGAGGPPGGVSVSPNVPGGSFVLTLRSVERVQRLVHRMSGAQARMRFSNIVGESQNLLEAVRLATIAAESASTVLLHGETGTGKEVFAQSIHNASARANGPFVAINCAAIPRELISSELFGYEGGAFTGADRHGRPGKFELANGGTLFLDEIGDMPRDLQTSLLRAIETRSVVRVGGQQVTPVDVRVVAATHKDLSAEVELGNFRSDLYFRLNVFPIEVPALRERDGDVPLLLRYVLQRLSTRLNRTLGVETDALAALEVYGWPGNVRELENVVERAVYVTERGVIGVEDLPDAIRAEARRVLGSGGRHGQYGALGAAPRTDAKQPARGTSAERGLRRESAEAEAALIARVLRGHDGNVNAAAATLGISRTTLWRKKRRYHL